MANNSLGKLGFALGLHSNTAGNTQTSLNACNFSAGTQVAMSEFLLVPSSMTPNYSQNRVNYSDYIVTFTITWATAGAKSNRIYTRAENFDDWSSSNATLIGFTYYGAGSLYNDDSTRIGYILGSVWGDSYPDDTCTIGTVFRDYYNTSGTAINKIYKNPIVI